MNYDKVIDQLMAERAEARARGFAQRKEDSAYLLQLLLWDVVQNPQRYFRQAAQGTR